MATVVVDVVVVVVENAGLLLLFDKRQLLRCEDRN